MWKIVILIISGFQVRKYSNPLFKRKTAANIFWVLVFEVLVFEVLVFEVLVFQVLAEVLLYEILARS